MKFEARIVKDSRLKRRRVKADNVLEAIGKIFDMEGNVEIDKIERFKNKIPEGVEE